MTDINITFTEEEVEAAPEGFAIIEQMIEDAQHIVDYPDAYNKAEVVAKLNEITTLLGLAINAGKTVIQGSIEIDRMINPPSQ